MQILVQKFLNLAIKMPDLIIFGLEFEGKFVISEASALEFV